MRRECKIKVNGNSELATIEVLGDLTASAEKDMDAAYQQACDFDPANIMLKFDGKSRINSAGIAIVIILVMESREKGSTVYITGVSKHFREIFQLVGLTKYRKINDSDEESGAESEEEVEEQ